MNNTELKGRLMLKVVGILYIIFAALSILTGLMAVVGGAALGIAGGECTADGKFSLDACRCVGACGLAPVLMVNDDVYGRLTVDDLDGILAKYPD